MCTRTHQLSDEDHIGFGTNISILMYSALVEPAMEGGEPCIRILLIAYAVHGLSRYCIRNTSDLAIEEGLKQKTRQNVVVFDWGSRSNAALGNFGVNV